jgi:hypothetical protein
MLCNTETPEFDFMACAALRGVIFKGVRPSKIVTKWSQVLKVEGQKNRKFLSVHEEAGSVLEQGGVGPTSFTERRTWALMLRRTRFTASLEDNASFHITQLTLKRGHLYGKTCK